MGSECVSYEGINFPATVSSPSSSKPLVLLGNGIYDTEIHFLQIKFYAIGMYTEVEASKHLEATWKGKPLDDLLAEDSGVFSSFCKAPVEKLFKIVIIKEVKGSQFVTPLQSTVRDRLAYADKYEEEEEEALDKLVDFFQRKSWFSKDTTIHMHWPSTKVVNVGVVTPEGRADEPELKFEISLENENIAGGILEWIVGDKSLSPSLLKSVATNLSQHFES